MVKAASRVSVVILVSALVLGPDAAVAGSGGSPNFVPELRLSYTDPVSGDRIECGDACRRFEVPAGVDLELRVRVLNLGGDSGSDGISWDLWFDQRRHPFPGIDVEACRDPAEDRLDIECWESLVNRVDWDSWDSQTADRVCVPEKAGDCDEVRIRVPMEADHDGSRGRGVYSFAVWVDRFRVHAEKNEFDNFVGPVRVKVVPANAESPVAELREDVEVSARDPLVVPSSPKPYSVRTVSKEKEIGFTLSSPRSRAVLEFEPRYACPQGKSSSRSMARGYFRWRPGSAPPLSRTIAGSRRSSPWPRERGARGGQSAPATRRGRCTAGPSRAEVHPRLAGETPAPQGLRVVLWGSRPGCRAVVETPAGWVRKIPWRLIL